MKPDKHRGNPLIAFLIGCLSIGRSFADAKTYGFLAGALFFSPLKFPRAPATQANLFYEILIKQILYGKK